MDAELAGLRELLAPLSGAAPIWLVGGAVRAALRGDPPGDDVDLIIDGDAAAAARRLAAATGADRYSLSSDFGSWRLSGGDLGLTVDITPLQGDDLATDLARRDFTVNAVAIPLTGGEPVDPHGGRADAAAGVLRMVGPNAFRSDPVRLVRLVRFAHETGMRADEATRLTARSQAALVDGATPERLMEELRRVLRLADAAGAVADLDRLGVLGALIPPLEDARGMEQNPYHHKDVLGHVLEVVAHTQEIVRDPAPVFRRRAPEVRAALDQELADGLTRGQALLLGALFHDVAKPATRAVQDSGRVTFFGHDRQGAEMADAWCRRWRTSTRLREFVVACVADHLVLGFMVHRQPLSLRQVHRYRRRIAPREIELTVLSVADRLATRGPRTRESAITRHLALARELMEVHLRLEDQGTPPPVIPGDRLADGLGRRPGPWLAEVLEAIAEEQVVGTVRTPEQALRFAERWLAQSAAGPGPAG